MSFGPVEQWSHRAGVSLRPWSGRAPGGLVLRGLIKLAVGAAIVWIGWRLRSGDLLSDTDAATVGLEPTAPTGWGTALIVVAMVPVLLGAAQVVIGVLDLVLRRRVTGRVVSIRERRMGDVLPGIVQEAIFERRDSGLDRRRSRYELVCHTPDGPQRWTIRSARTRRDLAVDAHVELRVSPIVGYVASARTINPPA